MIKNFKLIILCLALAFGYCSCAAIMMTIYGISLPKEKSEKQIAKGIHKYKLNEFDHYFISEEGFISFLRTNRQIYPGTKCLHLNDIFTFKNGKLVYPVQITGCNSTGVGLIRQLQDSTSYVIRDSISIDSLINAKNILNFDSLQYAQATQGKDFVILLYWGLFGGRTNKDGIKYPADIIKREIDSNNLNAAVFFVNWDIKEGWSFNNLMEIKE